MQVVFVPTHDVLENYYPVSHGAGRRLGLYSKSYETYVLCSFIHSYHEIYTFTHRYGHERALERMSRILIEKHHHHHKKIEHPCYPKGHTFEFSDRHFEGHPKLKECLKLTRLLFPEKAECLIPDCTFNGIYQPRLLQTPFVAISGLAKVARQLRHLVITYQGTSMERWLRETEKVCRGWSLERSDNRSVCSCNVYIHLSDSWSWIRYKE